MGRLPGAGLQKQSKEPHNEQLINLERYEKISNLDLTLFSSLSGAQSLRESVRLRLFRKDLALG